DGALDLECPAKRVLQTSLDGLPVGGELGTLAVELCAEGDGELTVLERDGLRRGQERAQDGLAAPDVVHNIWPAAADELRRGVRRGRSRWCWRGYWGKRCDDRWRCGRWGCGRWHHWRCHRSDRLGRSRRGCSGGRQHGVDLASLEQRDLALD